MSHRTKRRLEDFDPNASDPDDLDYGAMSPTRPQRRSKPSGGGGKKRPKKRQRQGYSDSDDDVDDDDEVSEDSFISASESSEEEPERNPRTGRPVRKAGKSITYEESDEDVIEESVEEPVTVPPRTPRRGKQSLIVKLPVSVPSMRTRPRTRGKTPKRGTTPDLIGMRRSSRLSHDIEEPLVALSTSGHHTEVVRAGTRSPEPLQRRAARAGKAPKKLPSAIMEASQEGSAPVEEDHNVNMKEEEEEEDREAEGEDDDEIQFAKPEPPTQTAEVEMVDAEEGPTVQESPHQENNVVEGDSDDEDDEGPVTRTGRKLKPRQTSELRRSPRKRGRGIEESSDFEPAPEEENEDEEGSGSEAGSRRRHSTDSSGARRSTRLTGRTRASRRNSESEGELDPDELLEEAEELAELNSKHRRSTRRSNREGIVYDDQPKLRSRSTKPDYRIFRPELLVPLEDDDVAPIATPQRNRRGGNGGYRSLFSIQGPFGGAAGPPPLFGGPEGTGAARGADSDSSDDDMISRMPRGVGGALGMTPTSAAVPGLLPHTHNADGAQAGVSGGPANFGKVKDKKALADADPLGVDQSVDFSGVGGLEGHIDQLKEMVVLPLLYPEVFQRFHVTPPRGVLFHGPPGTGKTLLARALANSVSSGGRKVTFYMRKGADALSKWVGEAERQLRLLFEEARKNQPSIIFFDEIDGLAPVRSSKQEQIHASIVATLLALMDGMDGRGQVIVIGATNRPDSVDPALRRPGRFDREFYFPLPNVLARRAIIDIHTKGWEPPLQSNFKDQLAELTKGYGGADLRALCTEAALNAVQGTYPQIYRSDKKLIIDPSTIKVLAKDFMISVNKMIPSSERSASSSASPLSKTVEPLLRTTLTNILKTLDHVLPRKKKLSALEEAQYDDRDDELGFEKENMQRDFESARIFRPRMLIHGLNGMGQNYLGPAILNKFESVHVQAFDLPTLLEDSARSPEAAIVQLFKEVRRHKPSVIYIPNVEVWYNSVSDTVIKTFVSLLRSLPPNDPVLLLGILEADTENSKELDQNMIHDLFGFSSKHHYLLPKPEQAARREFFGDVINYIRMRPSEFPNPENRKKRQIATLEEAPAPKAPEGPSKEQLKAQKKQDRHTLNVLKLHIQPIMDQLKNKYKKFRTPVIDDSQLQYLYDEQNPDIITTDLPPEQQEQQQIYRPFELSTDNKGVPGLRETSTKRFFYNLDIVMIEKRLSNGYYKRPSDFLADIKRLAKDSRTLGDQERTLKANEMLSNVEVDMQMLEATQPALIAECEAVYQRELQRERQTAEKARKAAAATGEQPSALPSNVPPAQESSNTESTGPVVLGEQIPGPPTVPPVTPVRAIAEAAVTSGEASSNGYVASSEGDHAQRQSNGSTVPSRPDEDHPMPDSQEPSSLRDQLHFATPSAPNTQHKSQKSARTIMTQGSQPADYHNSASTTTSGQKTGSNRSSLPFNYTQNTQSTNGVVDVSHPDFAALPYSGGSQPMPDTQELQFSTSQRTGSPPSQSSQRPFFAGNEERRAPMTMPTLLNPVDPPKYELDEKKLLELYDQITLATDDLSVEQLEQIHSTLMQQIWDERSEWNRNQVIARIESAFREVQEDIYDMMGRAPPMHRPLAGLPAL